MTRTLALAMVLFSGSLLSSAAAAPFSYIAYLDGPSESPPNASPGQE